MRGSAYAYEGLKAKAELPLMTLGLTVPETLLLSAGEPMVATDRDFAVPASDEAAAIADAFMRYDAAGTPLRDAR
jgi:hypothetical protein